MKCVRCGKKFHVTSAGWGYAYAGRYVCSYKCMREMQKDEAKVTEDEKKRAVELSEQGMDTAGISEELKVSRMAVGAYLGRRRKDMEAKEDQTAAAEAVPETEQAAPVNDELKLLVIRLMTDMVEILKKIV